MRNNLIWTVSFLALATAANAQDSGPSLTTFGTPGLLEMPTAESAGENQVIGTFSRAGTGGTKTSFTYQLTDRFFGSFRYTVIDQYGRFRRDGTRFPDFETFDRSFDLQYRVTDESTYLPAIAIGMRDFLGTGRFSSEYIVGSKSVGSNLIVTGGIGWGRMGEKNGFSNPLATLSDDFGERPVYADRDLDIGEGDGNGGQLSANQWFRGDAAFFGGFEYQVTPKLGFKAEYSSIAYDETTFTPSVNYESPFNYGITYRPNPGIELGLSYLYGTEIAAQASFIIDPGKRAAPSGIDPAPAPVRVRSADQRAAQTWDRAKQPEPAVRAGLTQLLAVEDIKLVGLEITDKTARLRYENSRYRTESQAMGRAARMMTQIIPPSVDTFILEPSQKGIPLSSATLLRSDIERLENRVGAADTLFGRTQFGAAGADDGLVLNGAEGPRFRWGVAPYLELTVFGTKNALSPNVGVEASAEYQISDNLVISGQVLHSLQGAQRPLQFTDIPNDYANVRTDEAFFGRHGGAVLGYLTATYTTRLAPEVYGRVTAGYLERMYGGISSEVLYAPVDSRWAVGAEVNYVAMRDQDMELGFAQYRTVRNPDRNNRRERVRDGEFSTISGHVSAYYDIGKGYHAQLDVGRYLAGDWGATFALNREFENGWKIGGYVTLTDMPFDQFGEGSFDKGILVTIPYDYFIGTPSRKTASTTLQSLSRDGGARLRVKDRLYGTVRDGRSADLENTWGRFWR